MWPKKNFKKKILKSITFLSLTMCLMLSNNMTHAGGMQSYSGGTFQGGGGSCSGGGASRSF